MAESGERVDRIVVADEMAPSFRYQVETMVLDDTNRKGVSIAMMVMVMVMALVMVSPDETWWVAKVSWWSYHGGCVL